MELHGWTYCPVCAAKLGGDEARVECPACGFVAYANAKPTASALCLDEQGRVLLGRRAREPDLGLWDLPGGFLEEHEHPLDALRRELREETGLEVEPLEFFGAWMDVYESPRPVSTLNLVWTVRAVGGELRPDDDVAELAWFPREALPPPDQLAFRMIDAVLSAWKEHA